MSSLSSTYQATAVHISEDSSKVVSAGIDNDNKGPQKKTTVVIDIQGHTDTVSGMKLSHGWGLSADQ